MFFFTRKPKPASTQLDDAIAETVKVALEPRAARWEFVRKHFGQAPHCDAKVLHSPGTCEYCDHRADLQAVRLVWGISFTGEGSTETSTCPSQLERPLEKINRWPGNRASRVCSL